MIGPQSALFVLRPEGISPGSIRISIVVPAFNESQRIPGLLEALERADLGPSDEIEIIVVDDGSSDATADVATAAGSWSPHLRVIRHETNRGKGAAVRTGVLAARGELIAFLDADNATDLGALGPMCEAIGGQVGAVFGSRHAPGASVEGSPPIRGLMGRVFNHVVRFAAGTSISDTQCGAKVFWAPAARVVFAASTIEGFAFDVEVLRRLTALGVGVIEYPVQWRYVAGTKIGPLTPLHMLRDIAEIRLRPDRRRIPGFECQSSPALRAIADPIVPGSGDDSVAICRVLVAQSEHASLEPARARLVAAGVDVGPQLRT